MHPLSDQDVLHHKTLHTVAKSLGFFPAKSAAEFVDKGLLDMDPLDALKGAEVAQGKKGGKAELVVEECVAKSFPPPPASHKEGVYVFNGHHLVASRTLLSTGGPLRQALCGAEGVALTFPQAPKNERDQLRC